MKSLLVLVIPLLAACTSAVEGEDTSSPAQTCEQLAEVVCRKYFECFSPDERAAAMIPASEAECVAATRADFDCSAQTIASTCTEAQTYDPISAHECVSEYEALSCDTVRTDIEDSDTPSCAQVCQ